MTGSPKRENIQGRRRPVALRLAGLLLLLSIAGCISLPILGPTLLLVRADRQAREGAWEEAVASYDEYLSRFPADSAAPRVLESRDTLAAMLTARAELSRRREEVVRLRDELGSLEAEGMRLREDGTRLRAEGSQLREELTRRADDLARARQELAARQAEAERLKADIERLKQIDLKLERRK